jgi:hypothetical protein
MDSIIKDCNSYHISLLKVILILIGKDIDLTRNYKIIELNDIFNDISSKDLQSISNDKIMNNEQDKEIDIDDKIINNDDEEDEVDDSNTYKKYHDVSKIINNDDEEEEDEDDEEENIRDRISGT